METVNPAELEKLTSVIHAAQAEEATATKACAAARENLDATEREAGKQLAELRSVCNRMISSAHGEHEAALAHQRKAAAGRAGAQKTLSDYIASTNPTATATK